MFIMVDEYESIIGGKERELRTIYSKLRDECERKQIECNEAYTRIECIQNDLAYNLDLIAKRDQELHTQDIMIQELQNNLQEREIRIKEQSVQIQAKSNEVSNLSVLNETAYLENNETVRKLNRENELKVEAQHDLLRAQLGDFERERTELYMKVKGAEHELDVQRNSVKVELERANRQHEITIASVKQSAEHMVDELKHQLSALNSELVACRATNEDMEKSIEAQLKTNNELEKELRETRWEFKE
jgi:chromosome segregation ATPase